MGNRAGNRYTLGQGGGRAHPLHGYTTAGAGTKPPTTHMHIKQQEEKPNNKFFFTTTDKIAGMYLSISASPSLSLSHSFLGLKTFFSIW